ncbi:hypothetical protein JW921_00980, partial [Candidatus Fermentibacterales bacterium]|nr:hypothetical protein [Candidatus Fermentibacterales bacterium]
RGDMVLTQEVFEGPAGYFNASFGASSAGLGSSWDGSGALDVVNLLGTGRELEIWVARVDWGGVDASARYREPWILGVPLSAEIRASQEVPESAWVNRQLELIGIWELSRGLSVWTGAGAWRGYPPEGPDESWDYGLIGGGYDGREPVRQGMTGILVALEGRAGRGSSGSDSAGVLASADLVAAAGWFEGALGLGADLRCAGVVEGDWLEGRLESVGGQSSLRGYPENAFRVGRYALLRPEVSLGETRTRAYAFCDLAVMDDGGAEGIFRASAGIGLRSPVAPLDIDACVGVPFRAGFRGARVYLTARTPIF